MFSLYTCCVFVGCGVGVVCEGMERVKKCTTSRGAADPTTTTKMRLELGNAIGAAKSRCHIAMAAALSCVSVSEARVEGSRTLCGVRNVRCGDSRRVA